MHLVFKTTFSQACPCGSGHLFQDCCAPYLLAQSQPATAEALMRSRFGKPKDRWLYVDGDVLPPRFPQPNQPCWGGVVSGTKPVMVGSPASKFEECLHF